MTAAQPPTPPDAKHLQCTEVWGGFETVDRPLQMPGLDGCVYSRPFRGGAGGDVHYVSSCGAGVYSRLLLADVSGHGPGRRPDRRPAAAADAPARRQPQPGRPGPGGQPRVRRRHRRRHVRHGGRDDLRLAAPPAGRLQRRPPAAPAATAPPRGEWSYLRRPGAESRDAAADALASTRRAADLPLGIEPAADYHEFEQHLGPRRRGRLLHRLAHRSPRRRRRDARLRGPAGPGAGAAACRRARWSAPARRHRWPSPAPWDGRRSRRRATERRRHPPAVPGDRPTRAADRRAPTCSPRSASSGRWPGLTCRGSTKKRFPRRARRDTKPKTRERLGHPGSSPGLFPGPVLHSLFLPFVFLAALRGQKSSFFHSPGDWARRESNPQSLRL